MYNSLSDMEKKDQYIKYKDQYIKYLETRVFELKNTIEKKDATLKELVELFLAHGIEITGVE